MGIYVPGRSEVRNPIPETTSDNANHPTDIRSYREKQRPIARNAIHWDRHMPRLGEGYLSLMAFFVSYATSIQEIKSAQPVPKNMRYFFRKQVSVATIPDNRVLPPVLAWVN